MRSMMRLRWAVALACGLAVMLLEGRPTHSADPVLSLVQPPGVQRGTESTLHLRGA